MEAAEGALRHPWRLQGAWWPEEGHCCEPAAPSPEGVRGCRQGPGVHGNRGESEEDAGPDSCLSPLPLPRPSCLCEMKSRRSKSVQLVSPNGPTASSLKQRAGICHTCAVSAAGEESLPTHCSPRPLGISSSLPSYSPWPWRWAWPAFHFPLSSRGLDHLGHHLRAVLGPAPRCTAQR